MNVCIKSLTELKRLPEIGEFWRHNDDVSNIYMRISSEQLIDFRSKSSIDNFFSINIESGIVYSTPLLVDINNITIFHQTEPLTLKSIN